MRAARNCAAAAVAVVALAIATAAGAALAIATAAGAAVTNATAASAARRSILDGPVAVATGVDGNVWVVDSDGVVRVTPSFAMTRVVSVTRAAAIVRGADGAMWFTVFSPPRIGRIDSSGQVTYFDLVRVPTGIAVGGDGNLWFTEGRLRSDDRGRIARMTPSGAVTEFVTGLRRPSAPTAIARGPGGELWFTDAEGRVGHVTLAGSISEYPVGGVMGAPDDIAAGPDGALWFTTFARIGRITPHGRIHLYASPFPAPAAIARGPDGSMWLTGDSRVVAGVWRIGVHGRPVKHYWRGFSDASTGAIARAGREMWVAETGLTGDHLVRVAPDGRAVEYPPPPRCRVPHMRGMPLPDVQNRLISAFCRLDASSARAGRARRSIALHVYPKPGTVLPYGTRVRVTFGVPPPLPKTCAVPYAGRRLVRTRRVLVFSYRREELTTYGACLIPKGPLRKVASGIDDALYSQVASMFKASGPLVAYISSNVDHYGYGSAGVWIADVRSGRRRLIWSQSFDQDCNYTHVTSLVLTRAGSTAWSDGDDSCAAQAVVYEVWLAGARGHARLLDSGAAVDPHSLRLDGHTITWRDGQETRSAPIR